MSSTSLFMATNALATDPHEDPSQAPQCVKRAQGTLGLTDNTSSKKNRTNPDTDEEHGQNTSENLYRLEKMPNEVLAQIAHYLENNDLLSFSLTSNTLRPTAIQVYLKTNSPSLTWTSALAFESDFEGQMKRFEFVAKIMPHVMGAMLVMYKNQHANDALAFKNLLDTHENFTSNGCSLKDTPLWTFLRSLKKAQPSSISLKGFPVSNDAGDGDKLFANMLHYIKGNFETSPALLAHYIAPRFPLLTSPQARMHKAALLKRDIANALNLTARTKLWDEVIETFDALTRAERMAAGQTYGNAAQQMNAIFPLERSALFVKSAQQFERALENQNLPDPHVIRDIAVGYREAALITQDDDNKARYTTKSAQYWKKYLKRTPEPTAIELNEAARIHELAGHLEKNLTKKTRHYIASAKVWDRYHTHVPNPTTQDLRTMAHLYANVSFCPITTEDKNTYFLKCAQVWQTYLAQVHQPTPDDLKAAALGYMRATYAVPTERDRRLWAVRSTRLWDKFIAQVETLSPDDMREAATSYAHTAAMVLDVSVRTSLLTKSADLWDGYFALVPNPSVLDAQNAVGAYCGKATCDADPAQKGATFLKAAKLCDQFLATIIPPNTSDAANASHAKGVALTYLMTALHVEDSSLQHTYALKSARWWGKYLDKNPTPTVVDLSHAVSAYYEASQHLSDPDEKVSHVSTSAQLCDLYFEKDSHPKDHACNYASKVYAEAATYEQDPQKKARYLRESARLKRKPPHNPTETQPTQGH